MSNLLEDYYWDYLLEKEKQDIKLSNRLYNIY